MKSRTRARCLALQVLYEVDIANHPPAEVFRERLEDTPLSDDLAEFVRQIVFGVFPLIHELDHVIEKYTPEWPLDQIAAIDRNILRISCWEFAIQNQTPVKVRSMKRWKWQSYTVRIARRVLSTACWAAWQNINTKSAGKFYHA